ncbi:hypothetical protein C9374_001150 [Naegleria lovaniensis]|uniref:EGF-like domain-containing protein n=1 Tax=Naegleria lovaniensis TaxID=51637 RepID=A0AA88GSH6_NAELO|nr:uncharacterized protein C9374_001150 [Naegleria lovaniensis]KAG2387556.1 hypothetical protein C9374_001150 [Naegleria lovaniensis]
MDNQYNLVEDCWMWGSQRRIISGNYRANYNVWRRVVVRGDGCGQTYCQGSGNPNVGFTVYDSHDTTVENMIIVDRILATGDYPGADFAAAQHTNDIKWYNGRNRWLGCITVNCPDVGFYLEPDYTLDPTFYLKNCVAVNTKETGLNIARKASNITYENVMAIRCEGDGIRVSPEPGVVSGVVRNAVSYGSGRYGINSQFKPSYVNVYGSGVSPFQQTTPTVGVSLSDPTTSSPVALKYPVRIEKNSFLSKTGYNNEDIGANIVVKYGLDGTRFGDSNVELLTANSLWPWPNEDRIKAEMCASTTRGFCSSGKRLDGVNAVTLTSYIWEILGNPIPTEIYQNSNTSTTCFGIDSTSAQVCSGHGVCVSLDSCSCTGGYTGSNCATAPAITCFGIAQGNASVCSGHGNCVANNQCSCTGGYTGSNCATPPSNAISCYGIAQGNSSVCSGHGTCTAQDQCNCNSGYSGTKCENVNQPKPSPIVSKSIRNFNSTTRNDSSALFEGNKVVTWGWMILVVFMFVEWWM